MAPWQWYSIPKPRCKKDHSIFRQRANAFSTSANATAGKTADDNVHKDAPKKDIDDQIADIQILRNLWKYLRMNNSRDFNIRIVLLLGLLVGAKHLVALKPH